MKLNLRQLDIPESKKLIEKRMRELKEKGYSKFEVSHYRKDGSLIPLEITIKLAKWGIEDVMESIAIDISERKKAEINLKKSAVQPLCQV